MYDIVHDGGEAIEISQLNMDTGNSSASLTSGEVSATDVVAYGINSSDEVTITWENPNSDESQILFEQEAP